QPTTRWKRPPTHPTTTPQTTHPLRTMTPCSLRPDRQRSGVLLFVLLCVTMTVTPAVAHDTVTPTPAQSQLNNQGVAAMTEGKFDVAADYFRTSLDLGESNLG